MWVSGGRSCWVLCVGLSVVSGGPFVFGVLGIRLFLGEVVGGGVNLYFVPGEALKLGRRCS